MIIPNRENRIGDELIMYRRLIWSTIIASGIMAIIMPLNLFFYPSAESIPEAVRTVAQQIAVQQRNASFFTLTIVEGMLAWLIGFQVSNEWFRQHPTSRYLFRIHRELTGIPEKYYKVDGVKKSNEAADKASDDSSKNSSKGEGVNGK